MLIRYIFIILFSFLFSLILPDIVRRFLSSTGLIPEKAPASIGGISICLSVIAVSLMFPGAKIITQPKLSGLLLAGAAMLIFGVIDDLKELSVMPKFLTQLMAIGLLLLFGIKSQIPHIGALLNLLITVLWVLGITNALNHLDVADGIAASIAVTSCLAFFIFTSFTGQAGLGLLCLILAGAILGFLKHNLPPAKIYLGNAGSHFLGFTLAAAALSVNYSALKSGIAVFIPLIILGVPILDTAYLALARLKQGKSPLAKSNDHIVLRLLRKGFSKHDILALAVLCGVFFCAGGIILAYSLM
ncbi:MAG: MraY family glycosyltransferase [Candidatus Omnitrophica bacterium]|nr:MraY family glycosyltransferase [Candidatus Omnitrophota bacterium]